MTGSKRKMKASPEDLSPSRKAARVGDNDDDGYANSSQPTSSQPPSSLPVSEYWQPDVPTIAQYPPSEPPSTNRQINDSSLSQLMPPSSQAMLSQARISSQGDDSFSTDRSLSDVSVRERTQWREYTDPTQFFNFAGWGQAHLNYFLVSSHSAVEEDGISFPEWLVAEARRDISLLYLDIGPNEHQSHDKNTQIDWTKIPHTRNTPLAESEADNLIYVWINLKKFSYTLHKRHHGKFTEMMCNMLPITKREERELQKEAAALAFHRDEKLTCDGLRPSESVYKTLLQYYQVYDAEEHLAPYTSLVGPSGIGKSFAIKQLAMHHNMYVVYASLARRKPRAYPRRSAVANVLPRGSGRHGMVEFWESFITIGLSEAELCKQVGITPAGFFNLQTKEDYSAYQTEFAQRVVRFFLIYNKLSAGTLGKMANSGIPTLLSTHASDSRVLLSRWRQELSKNDDNHHCTQHQSYMQQGPRVLICVDEARELIRDEETLLFRSLREALRSRFHRLYEPVDLSKPQRDFFTVLLDTTSKVADFSPPAHSDPSQKEVRPFGIGQKLFSPIYALDTMDLFADLNNAQIQDGSLEAILKLFVSGRPVWGGRSNTEGAESPEDPALALKKLALDKTEGQSTPFLLALLSFRVNFYVINDAWAEELVGTCMRYIVYINEARDLLRTTQPSEPILAFAAAERMKKPSTRLNVIRQFVASCFQGTVNVGNVGEMVASLLLLFAYDEIQFHHAPRALPAPIRVSCFMESLFGDERQAEMAKRMVIDPEMKDQWETGEVFFNHFARAPRAPDEAMIAKAFGRGTALFLPDGFKGADILIPINIPGSGMTFCLVQVKNCKRDHSTPDLRNKAKTSIAGAVKTMGLAENHIGIMMCLRHQPPATDPQLNIVLPEEKTPRVTRRIPMPAKTYSWGKRPKALVLAAFGLDETLYQFMNGCMGQKTQETERILPLLHRLLDCVPGTPLPDDIEGMYVDRLDVFR